jgi:lysophospholipase L1-like esterase
MKHGSGSRWDRRRLIRLAILAALGVGIFLSVSLGPPWFHYFFPIPMRRRIVVQLLLVAQAGYGLLLATVPVALIGLTVALVRARRRGARRIGLIRGLALCVAVSVSLAMAEGVSAVWLAWTRVPTPRLENRFPDPADQKTVNILVLGESSAFGVPYQDWFSVAEIVAWKLREAIPDRCFDIEYLARPGLTLDKIHFWMRSMQHRPDLVILYAGHNEFDSRYNWSHAAFHYADEMPPRTATLESFAREHSPLCRLIQQTIGIYRISIPSPRHVTRQLVDVPVYTAAEYAERLHDFRTRLEVMVSHCERLGALVVLVPPPGNDADFEPNRSFLASRTTRAERLEFARAFEAARQTETVDPVQGIAAYRELLARQPGFADAHFRLARLLEAAGQREEANQHYVAARDCDGFPMRCVSDFLAAYHEVAARHPRAILVDAPQLLRSLSPRGTLGDEFFADGLHPSLIGYTELAQAILQGLHARRAFGWLATSPEPVVTPSECAAHFGMDNKKWASICEYDVWFYYMTAFIRYDPSERLAKQSRFLDAKRQIEKGSRPETLQIPGIGTDRVATQSRTDARRPTSGHD